MNIHVVRIQNYIRENALDAFLVLTKINRQYVSGFTGSAGIAVIYNQPYYPRPKGEREGPVIGRVRVKGAALYVDDRYLIRARRESELKVLPLDKLTMTPSPPPPHEGEVGRGSRRLHVGIEDKISLREFQRLKKDYPGVKWVVTDDVVENLRAVKTAQEIWYIKKAQTIIDQILSAVKKWAIAGMTENAVAQTLERLAIKFGADGMAFESIVAWGPNAAAPHHLSGRQKIKKNNFLLLDFGVLVNGYHSDFTRTLFIGKPNKKQEKVYNTVLEAQKRAIEKVRAGVKASEIDFTARTYIAKHKFGKYFTHNTGHGVGLEIHELPNFSPQSEDILRENMIVTVEPGIYIEKWGGVRIEDMVLVGETPKLLSKAPKDLRCMIID